MGNQSSKSKHKLKITDDGRNLESAYNTGGRADLPQGGSPKVARPLSTIPPGVNLDHRLSLPVNQTAQKQQQSSTPVAPRQSPQVQPRQQQRQQQQQQQQQKAAPRPHSMAPATVTTATANSTMTADIQLVLNQLIEKKPKYSLLKQLDFSELDERARFVVFEAACDLLDQAKTIESLREERQMMRSNLNVVRRVASIDHLDNPRHRRVASQELASCINQELQRRPPKLAPAGDSIESAAATSSTMRLLGDLITSWQQLEKHFLESTRQELLSRRGLFADSVLMCRAVHELLADMLVAAEALHRKRLDELVETVTSPTDARGMQVLRARLKLPTEESKAVRGLASQLLSQASDLCQLPWDSLVDASKYPSFRQAPSNVGSFLSNCSAWCWRAVCSNLGRVSLSCVEEGAPFRQEQHRAELGLGVGRPVTCCLWPILYQNKTLICKALVQTAPTLGPISD